MVGMGTVNSAGSVEGAGVSESNDETVHQLAEEDLLEVGEEMVGAVARMGIDEALVAICGGPCVMLRAGRA